MGRSRRADLEDNSNEESQSLVEPEPCAKCGHKPSTEAAFCPRCGARMAESSGSGSDSLGAGGKPWLTSWLCVTMVILCVLCAITGIFTMVLNAAAKSAIEIVGSAALGVPTTVGSVSLALFSARSEISSVHVATWPGYGQDDFLQLEDSVADIRMLSLMAKPFEMQEISVRNLRVNIDQTVGGSNAQMIIDHVTRAAHQATDKAESVGIHVDTKMPAQTVADELHTATYKIIADKLAFANISTKICIHPICDGTAPVEFTLRRILIRDVGKRNGGVYLYELIEIIVQAVLIAVVHAAPGQLGQNMLMMMNGGLAKVLDYASLHLDAGAGLQQVGAWTGAQLDLLGNATSLAGSALGQVLGNATNVATDAMEASLGNATGQAGAELKEAWKNATGGADMGDSVEKAIDNVTAQLGKDFHSWGDQASGILSGIGKGLSTEMAGKAKDAVTGAPEAGAGVPTAPPPLPPAGSEATTDVATAFSNAIASAQRASQAAAPGTEPEPGAAAAAGAAKEEMEAAAKGFGSSLLGQLAGSTATPAPTPAP